MFPQDLWLQDSNSGCFREKRRNTGYLKCFKATSSGTKQFKSKIIILNPLRPDPEKRWNTSKHSFASILDVFDCFLGSSLKGLREAS